MIRTEALKKFKIVLKLTFENFHFVSLKLLLNYINNSFQALLNRERNLASEILYYERKFFLLLRDPKDYLDRTRRNLGFPDKVLPILNDLKGQFNTNKLRLLEIGSGPNSNLAHYVDKNLFKVIAIDPLAETYKKIMKKINYDYPIIPIKIKGEDLLDYLKKETFHIIYTQNSLDHTENPIKCIVNASILLKKNGIFFIRNNVKEGSRKHWMGLHKYDFYFHNNELYISDKNNRIFKLFNKNKLGLELIFFLETSISNDLKQFQAAYKKI